MERRKALAIASATTALVGGGIVAAAAFSGASLLGFGGTASAHASAPVAPVATHPVAKNRIVVRTRDVFDRIVVATTSPATAARTPEPAIAAPLPEPAATTTPTTVATPRHVTQPSRSDDGGGAPETPSTVAAPTPDDPTTTVPPSPPTTMLRGEIPDDWPAGKPIPPIPPNCHEPQLHLNGVWECSGSGD